VVIKGYDADLAWLALVKTYDNAHRASALLTVVALGFELDAAHLALVTEAYNIDAAVNRLLG